MSELYTLRRRAGWARERVAVAAAVSVPTVKLYEANPEFVRDEFKRQRLDDIYTKLRAIAESRAA